MLGAPYGSMALLVFFLYFLRRTHTKTVRVECAHTRHTHIQAHFLCEFYLTYYAWRVGASKADGRGELREPSNGVCGCVRDYIFHQVLDAVHGSSKVFFCDAHAASALSCSLRLHDLMEHGVTLFEDPVTPRQPIISSPAPYFFAVEDASVSRVVEDWMAKVAYRDVHVFALGCTPHRSSQQLARARIAPRAMRFKDIMLDFTALRCWCSTSACRMGSLSCCRHCRHRLESPLWMLRRHVLWRLFTP
ncbi:putative syntaxin binding protein [Trypanosoma cruzi]|uniref:Putative syntaxin binding protein n=1 Tax=Trypanosoma cruzi TaxID=5693 RepID=A0A2V2XI00_TRYCR|nr:putative syntaxin binding protein [Trypanosoma cruzi]RNC54716.1 putative syntaxin binding protein [Trypanosoma cruzi]